MSQIPRDQQPTNPSWRPPQSHPQYGPPSRQPEIPSLTTAKRIVAKFSVTAGLLYAGLALAAISVFLPWTTVTARVLLGSQTFDASPFRGGWIFLILCVIAGAGWLAWPTIVGTQMLVKRLAGLSGVVCLMVGFFVIGLVNYANADSENQKMAADAGGGLALLGGGVDVSLGFGFLLYTAALVVIGVGLGRLWSQRLPAGKRVP